MHAMTTAAEQYPVNAVCEYRAAFPDIPGMTALAVWHVMPTEAIDTHDQVANQAA